MKKRLLSALLALALVFVLLPTTALADTTPVTDENVKINGTAVIVGNNISLGEGNGTYSYDKATHTLTLNSATINATGSNIGIEFCDTTNYVTYSVILTGENTVTSNNIAIETTPNTNLTFTGGGNLKAITNGYYQAIRVYGTLTIDNSTLIAESSAYTATTVIWTLAMTGNNAKLEISNKSAANIVAGTAGPASNIDWSNYQFTTGSYSGDALTESDPEVCSWGTLKKYFGYPTKEYSQYICIAKRTIPALTKTSDVLIAGENAVVGQWTNIPAAATGTGSYYYDADKKELTLKDVNITHSDGAIVQFLAGAPYIIKLEGTNSIKDVSSLINVRDAYESLDGLSVTISGAGSLEVIARGNAITMLKGNLIFNNTGAITLETTTVVNGKAINVSGDISIGSDFNKNLKITADNGAATFDPTSSYTVYNDLKNYKSISFATPNSTISYGNKTLKQGETIYGETSGTATVDRENNTITLNNFKGTQALSFEATLADSTLVLEGTNTLSSIVTTQKGLTISVSGSGSLTVGSIRVPNNTQHTANLTITGGAHVTVNRPSGEDEPAVEVSGNLTVTGEGTQLSAECTAATNPAIEVGGNVTISGNPGTNAYTVKAYNKYAIQRGRDDKLRPSQMPSAIEISGDSLSISGSAQVMAKTDSDGAAVWMPAQKVISVADASLIAQNRSHNFSTISFGDESNMGNIYAKGQEVNIVAENMLGSNSSLAHRAIKAFIYNHYNTGDSNPYYIKVVSEGVQSGGNVNVIPGHHTSTGDYKVTITRGDAYTTPQVAANYTIAGQTMYVGKYYKTDVNGNITDGTAQDYNIYCDSKNDFTLNNATISSTGTDVAINTNIRYETNVQHHIKLIGTNRINNTFKHAISAGSNSSTIIIEGVGNASDASLTINGNFLPIYSDGKVIINAEVVIVNTTDDNSFKGLISTSDGKGAFDLGSGYKCYASTSTTGTPLEEFNSANYSTYKYLRVTTLTLETGGGSTHQHVEGPWEADTQGGHHIKKCTECGEVMISEEHRYNYTYESPTTHKVNCGVCGVNFVRAHSYTNSYVPTEDGTQHHGKCICGAEETTLRDHVFVNGVCVCGVTQSGGDPTPDVPAAPTGLVGVAPTSENGNGKITGTTAQMEYASSLEGDWTTCANDSTDVPAGKYYVRMKKTDNTPAGEAVEVTVPAYSGTGEIVPPTPDNPGTIVIIRPAEEEKPAQQPNPSTGANDLVGLAVAAAVAAALGSAALLRKHD